MRLQAAAFQDEPGYEPHDIDVAAVGGVLIFVLLLLLATYWGMGLFAGFAARGQPYILSTTPSSSVPAATLPPRPRLQVSSPTDYRSWKAEQDALLASYGINPDGTIRIPIERAMEILVGRETP